MKNWFNGSFVWLSLIFVIFLTHVLEQIALSLSLQHQ
jgi:hypothetical protein